MLCCAELQWLKTDAWVTFPRVPELVLVLSITALLCWCFSTWLVSLGGVMLWLQLEKDEKCTH